MIVVAEVKLPATLGHLREFIEVAASGATSQGFSADRVGEIELAMEEVFVNIARYAYEGQPGTVEMVIKADEAGNLHIELIDEGVPFDSTTVPEPDLEASIDDRDVGGLGIFFIKQLMDEINYSRQDGKNILKFTALKNRPE
ncbi:ATP-binding protein [Candidatus Magnetominusculus dajiuhuensis]|uniref:ATP-binding protein n=1 Tax=Candidatus Magnetominusculus dajiuhuensis TaxID=3137712 RepID=UPI003B42EEC4